MKVWSWLIFSVILSVIATGLSSYSVVRTMQPASAIVYTSIGLGQTFNWTIGEVVEVQGNLYMYQGYEGSYFHFARWQNGWVELTYYFGSGGYQNATLYPYRIQVLCPTYGDNVYEYQNKYATVQFLALQTQ